jgi:HK97 family phage major capsid protein
VIALSGRDDRYRPKWLSGPDLARRAGRWIQATLLEDAEAGRWCRDNGLPLIKAQGEGLNAAGDFLVPDEIERQIIYLRDVAGVFRAQADVRPMGSERRTFPRSLGGLTAYFTAEQAMIAESQNVWDNVLLSVKKLGVLTRLSSEVFEDEAIGLGEALIEEIAYAFASKEDDCGFNGDGTSAYGGMTGITQILTDGKHAAGAIPATSGHDTFPELDATDLDNMMGALPAYALETACWYASSYAIATCFGRLTIGGTGTSIRTTPEDRPYLNYLGYPIIATGKLPGKGSQFGKVMLIFGDLSLSTTFGYRRGVTVAQSRHRALELDQVLVRATERFDINNHDLGDDQDAGPVVGLIGA